MTSLKDRTKYKKKSPYNCCEKEMDIVFEGDVIQYPIFLCSVCGEKRDEWSKWWQIYSLRWKEKNYWENTIDKPSCLIGYFCNKFKEFYGFSYAIDISNPIPYKGKEFVMARRILNMLGGNSSDIRIYIKWVFANKIKTSKKSVTSLGFFANAQFVNEFNFAKARSSVMKRYTMLPDDYIIWCKNNFPDFFEKQDFKTWNDLNLLVQYEKTYKLKNIEYKILMEAVNRSMLPFKNNEPDFRQLED